MHLKMIAVAAGFAAGACGGASHVKAPDAATVSRSPAAANMALPLASALLRQADLGIRSEPPQTHAGAAPAGTMTAPGRCARPVADAYRTGLAEQVQQVTRDFPLGSGAVSELLIQFRTPDEAGVLATATVALLTRCPTSINSTGGHRFTTTASDIRRTPDGYIERFTSAVDGGATTSATQVLHVRGPVWVLVIGFGPGMPPALLARTAETATQRAASVLHL